MKKWFKKFLYTFIFSVFCLISVNKTDAFAFNSVSEFLNAGYSSGSAQLINGRFYFCQGDVAPTSRIYYRTVGFKVEVKISSGTYSFSTPINGRQAGIGGLFHAVQEHRDGLLWDLWSISYYDIITKLMTIYPWVDFTQLLNGNEPAVFTFRGYVTHTENYGADWFGTLYENGTTSGAIYCREDNASKPYYYMSDTGWNALRTQKRIGAGGHYAKPGKPSIDVSEIYVPNNLVATNPYIYQNPNNNRVTYVKTGEEVTFRFDSRLSYHLNNYSFNQMFFDTTDYSNNGSGTVHMYSNSDTQHTGVNKWFAPGSFTNRANLRWTSFYRHNSTLVTNDMAISFDTEEIYNLYPRAMTYFNNNYDTYNFGFNRFDSNNRLDSNKVMQVISDGTPPRATVVEIENISSDGFDVVIKDVTDDRAGVGEVLVPVWTKPDKSDLVVHTATKQPDGSYKVTVNTSSHNNYKGSYTVTTELVDNVGNSATIDSQTIEVGNRLVADIVVSDYEYLDPNGVKWVQVNNKFKSNLTGDAISLQTDSHINILAQTSYELNPDGTEKQFSPLDFVIPDSMRDGQKLNNVVKGNNTDLPYFKFDDKKAFTHKINDRSFKGYAEQWFTKDVDFEYNALVRAVDKNGVLTGETGYHDQGIIVKADGNAPTSSSNSAQYIPASDGVILKLNGVEDNRSGVKPNTVVVKVYHKDNPNDKKQLQLQVNRGNDYVVTIPSLGNLGFDNYGDYIADFIVSDNVGNVDKVGTATFVRTDPIPKAEYAVIEDYEYQDPNGIKWVKVDNEFKIKQLATGSYFRPTALTSQLFNKEYTSHLATFDGTRSSYNISKNHNNGFVKSRNEFAKDYDDSIYTNGTLMNYYLKALSSLHGTVYRLKHLASYTTSGKTFTSPVKSTDEYLGIDGEGPIVDYVQTGRNEIQVTVRDDDSGLNSIVTDLSTGESNRENLSGNTQTIIINLGNSSNSNLTVTDNVGNQTIVNIGDIRTSVQSSINVEQVTVSNRKKLKVTVTAKVINPVPNQTMTLRITGDGDGVPVTSGNVVVDLYAPNGNPVNYVFYVDDKYNQPNGPSLSYGAGSNNFVGVNVGALSDLTKDYTFKLLSIYPSIETNWTEENKKTTSFASGYNHFKFNLIRLTDDNFVALPNEEVLLRNAKVSDNFINMSYVQSGKYKVQVTMYDYNGNPSGMTQLIFDHNQPEEFSQLGLNVTAVKDITWEKETYPISYKADKSKFPLGSAYKFNNNPIKLGYTLNFNIELPNTLNYVNPKAVYTVYGKDSSGNKINLVLKSGIDTLSALDSSTGTTYLSQTSDFIKENNALYLKHYLPANTKAYLADGSIYKGQIYVDLNFTADLRNNSDIMTDIGRISGQYHLYSVTQDSTALDDLEVNKQR